MDNATAGPGLAYIHCIFGWRAGEDSPELLIAWDEYSVDQNPEGWAQQAETMSKLNDIPMRSIRTAKLAVIWSEVEELFYDPTLTARRLDAEVDPLLKLANRIINLDEPSGADERRRITMTMLIEWAKDAKEEAAENRAVNEHS